MNISLPALLVLAALMIALAACGKFDDHESILNTKIAFTSDRDGNAEIYVMNADGTEQTRLTDDPRGDGSPSWSPDGTKMTLNTGAMSRRGWNIYAMNADGTGRLLLTEGPCHYQWPSWSPDGITIALVGWGEECPDKGSVGFDIYTVNADGTNLTRLTHFPGGHGSPAYSPDGSQIAFVSTPESGTPWEIHVMNADGRGQVRLTDSQASNGGPAWSPDGMKIAFDSERDGNKEIYVMNADGSGQTRITDNQADDTDPTWSPDGLRIAFVSDRDGNREIYVMNADGGDQTRLTNNPDSDSAPAWSPFIR